MGLATTEIARIEGLEHVTKGVNRKSVLAREPIRKNFAPSTCNVDTGIAEEIPSPVMGIGRTALFEENPDWESFQDQFGALNTSEGNVEFPGAMIMYHVTPEEVVKALQMRITRPIVTEAQIAKASRLIAKECTAWLSEQLAVSSERVWYRNFVDHHGAMPLEDLVGSSGSQLNTQRTVQDTAVSYFNTEDHRFHENTTVSRQEEIEFSFLGFDKEYYGISFDDFDGRLHSEHTAVVNMVREVIGQSRFMVGKNRWQPRLRTFQINTDARLGQQTFVFPEQSVPNETSLSPVGVLGSSRVRN